MSHTLAQGSYKFASIVIPLLCLVAILVAASEAYAGIENGRIAFLSNRDSNFEIYSMNADGSDQVRLTDDPGTDALPAWSPDGTKIAFISDRDGGETEIYVMNTDGTDQQNLTNDASRDTAPSWSPNGTKIVYMSDRSGSAEIYTMNADGSNQAYPGGVSAAGSEPQFSPDGTKIVFISERDGGADEIYIMNADGSNQTRLTDSAGADAAPAWSPDGSKIAFFSMRGSDPEIYVMNADGTDQTNLTNHAGWDYHPEWSPDGTKITFFSYRSPKGAVYVMNADGTDQTAVGQQPDSDNVYPAWQPVITADPDETAPTPVTTQPSYTLSLSALNVSNRKKIKRATLYNYLNNGFSGSYSGYNSVKAYLVRVKQFKIKGKGQRATKTVKRCYKIHRPRKRIACSTRTTNGVTLSSTGELKFKPLGNSSRSKSLLKNLNKGSRMTAGYYRLVFDAYPASGAAAHTYTFYLKVSR